MPPSTRRRRRRPTGINIPGQRERINIEGSQYGIHRQPDEFVVHRKPGAEHVTVAGSKTHINVNVRPKPIPRPREKPLFDFDVMKQELGQKIAARLQIGVVNLGGPKDLITHLGRMEAPKYESRWPSIGKNMFKGERYLIHPFDLWTAMTSKKTGRAGFRNKTTAYNVSREIRPRYEARVNNLYRTLEAESQTALNTLATAVQGGQVNWGNRGHYIKQYEKALKQAETNFDIGREKIMTNFRNEPSFKKVTSKKRTSFVKRGI